MGYAWSTPDYRTELLKFRDTGRLCQIGPIVVMIILGAPADSWLRNVSTLAHVMSRRAGASMPLL